MKEDILRTDKDTLVGKKHLKHHSDIRKADNYYTLHQMADGALYLQGWIKEAYYLDFKEEHNCILHGIITNPNK